MFLLKNIGRLKSKHVYSVKHMILTEKLINFHVLKHLFAWQKQMFIQLNTGCSMSQTIGLKVLFGNDSKCFCQKHGSSEIKSCFCIKHVCFHCPCVCVSQIFVLCGKHVFFCQTCFIRQDILFYWFYWITNVLSVNTIGFSKQYLVQSKALSLSLL